MNYSKDGGPAFPCEVDSTQPLHRQVGNTVWQTYGMSLRDYFAAKALTGLIASAEGDVDPSMYGKAAYLVADAMLKARSA